MPLLVKATKFEAAYTNTAREFRERCVLCVNFIVSNHGIDRSEMGTCEKVIGIVNAAGWCKFYDHKLKVVSE